MKEEFGMIPRFLGCGLGNGGQFIKTTYNIEEKEQAWDERKERGKAEVLSEKKGTVFLVCRMSIFSSV